jgi:predicted small secreted protein
MAMKTISLALLALSLLLGGCNTVDGMGKDLKALANKIDGKTSEQPKKN